MQVRTSVRAGGTYYTVRPGDSLSSIAAMFYGGPPNWNDAMYIYNANQSLIGPNPNYIRVGTTLYIPDKNAPPPPGSTCPPCLGY